MNSRCLHAGFLNIGASRRMVASLLLLVVQLSVMAADAAAPPTPATFDERLVQANVLFKAGKLTEALAEVRAAAKLDPNRYEAPATEALILRADGKTVEAKAAIESALRLVPADKKEKVQSIAQVIGSAAAEPKATNAPPKLTGATRRQFDTLLLIIEDADKAKLDGERKQLLREFLEKSEPFLKEQPDQLAIWSLRAVAALELNLSSTGWTAGQSMIRLGAEDSDDSKMRKVMAALDRKGWLAKEPPADPFAAAKEKPFMNSLGMKFVPVPGTEVLFSIWETRVKDYAAYAAENTGIDSSWKDPVAGVPVTPGAEHPVVNVSWNDAVAFAGWLTKNERAAGKIGSNQSYRLPTDAEWSLAVGLTNEGDGSPKDKSSKIPDVYPWGTQWPPPIGAGNFADEAANRKFPYLVAITGYSDGYVATSPVGSFAADAHGLSDLSGNVREWCQDAYEPGKNAHVVRGGSWNISDPRYLLSSFRYNGFPDDRNIFFGFRLVVVGLGR